MPVTYTATVGSTVYGFDWVDQEVEVDAGTSTVDATSLKTAIKEAEASEQGIVYPDVATFGNPVLLTTGLATALNVIMLDPWRLHSLKTSGSFTLQGGNIVSESDGADVIAINTLVDQNNILSQSGVRVDGAEAFDPTTDILEGSITYEQGFRIMFAALAGKSTKAGTSFTFRDLADAKDRISATTDGAGARTSVAHDGS